MLEHPRRLRRPVLVRTRRLLRDRRLHLDPAAAPLEREPVAGHAGGRRARRRLRALRGLSVLSLRPARPLLLAGDPGLRRDAAGGGGELEGGGLLPRPRGAEPRLGARDVPVRGEAALLLR